MRYLILILVMAMNPLFGDMGAIVPVQDVKLKEPAQRAIIAHNGKEEILILGIDLDSPESTSILRFIPLPSEPIVKLAPEHCFDNLQKLVERYKLKYVVQYKGPFAGELEPIKLELHKKIGAHDITVLKVTDPSHFNEWVRNYFCKIGFSDIKLDTSIEGLVKDYIERRICYFVFDYVALKKDTTHIRPVLYKFLSKNIYYPLKTSNLFGGNGTIILFLFSRDAHSFIGSGFMASTSAKISDVELRMISPDAWDLMRSNRIVMQAFKYSGKLKFKRDIFARVFTGMEELVPYSPHKDSEK